MPVSEGVLQHASTQMEAGVARQVNLEIAVLALGDTARWLQAAPMGQPLKISGFLAAKSRQRQSPVLHVNSIEFLEGNNHGSILQEEG